MSDRLGGYGGTCVSVFLLNLCVEFFRGKCRAECGINGSPSHNENTGYREEKPGLSRHSKKEMLQVLMLLANPFVSSVRGPLFAYYLDHQRNGRRSQAHDQRDFARQAKKVHE